MIAQLRIVFIADIPQIGGASECLYDLVQSLQYDYGAYCIVLFSSNGPLKHRLDSIGIRTIVTGHRGFLVAKPQASWKVAPKYVLEFVRYFANRSAAIRKAENAIDFSKIDIVHSNLPRNDLGIMLAARNGIPHVCHLRELSFEYFHCWSYRKNPTKYLSEGSNALIAVSQACGKAWISRGIDSEKLKVVYDGINLETYKRKEPNTSRDRKDRMIKLLFLGGYNEAKGIWDAIRAIDCLPDTIKNLIVLDVYGSSLGKTEHAVRKWINERNLGDCIKLHGLSNSVVSLMHASDVGLVCTKGEAFGRVIIEYQAAGLAVIGADVGAIPEILGDGARGLLYNKSIGAPALADAICKLVNNRSLLLHLQNNGPSYAQLFSREHSVHNCMKVYEALIKGQ